MEMLINANKEVADIFVVFLVGQDGEPTLFQDGPEQFLRRLQSRQPPAGWKHTTYGILH